MKICLILIMAFISWMGAFAQTPAEYFSVGNPIKYCGTDYWLAWSSHPSDIYYIQEYLPKGDKPEHFNKMFTVNVLFSDLALEHAVAAKKAELDQRKKADPCINYITSEKKDTYILEFIVSDAPGGNFNTVEANVYYYRRMKIGERNAIVLCFYSERAYGDDITDFIPAIPSHRAEWYTGIENLNLTPEFLKK